MVNVLFVCLGNICRSPMAEALFRHEVKQAGLVEHFSIDSAGTGNWHTGKGPHEGTVDILQKHSIDHGGLTARQVEKKDLSSFHYVIAMDASNMGNLQRMKGYDESGELFRLLDFVPARKIEDVPDPYFTGNFDEVFELVQEGCRNLLNYIREQEKL